MQLWCRVVFFQTNDQVEAMTEKEKKFTEWVASYKAVIYAVCYMFFSSRQDSDDAFQEILLRIWRGFDSFQDRSTPKTWIYRVALNTCISLSKSSKRFSKGEPFPKSLAVEESSIEKERFELLDGCLRRLPFVERSIILMRLEGMSYEEIASVIGISKDNLSVKLVRIKERLSKMLNTSRKE